jgi:hypoxanthine-guanine phosphoribosyltransferase
MEIDFVKLTSLATVPSTQVKYRTAKPNCNIRDRHVLVGEEIVTAGDHHLFLCDYLSSRLQPR